MEQENKITSWEELGAQLQTFDEPLGIIVMSAFNEDGTLAEIGLVPRMDMEVDFDTLKRVKGLATNEGAETW